MPGVPPAHAAIAGEMRDEVCPVDFGLAGWASRSSRPAAAGRNPDCVRVLHSVPVLADAARRCARACRHAPAAHPATPAPVAVLEVERTMQEQSQTRVSTRTPYRARSHGEAQAHVGQRTGISLYDEVTSRIIAELEAGRLPWVQPWESGPAPTGLPFNAATGRPYSGINILVLWATLFERGYAAQRWLTYRQAQALGGTVRKGERGTTVCYVDRFTPKGDGAGDSDGGTAGRGSGDDQTPRQIAFLKRFTVFNVDQCTGLPEAVTAAAGTAPSALASRLREPVTIAEALIAATRADIRIGGDCACYRPGPDSIEVPPQPAFLAQIDYYRTVLHELGHWTGHASRLDRFSQMGDRKDRYAREELVAELTSAFTCASLGIVPTVRHADYIGAWLDVLRDDNRAIFRAASQASKAADFLLAFRSDDSAAASGEAGR